tara:strand:+ start:5952 stop:6185 length:234 start_codon:yes stop_codon:yes gene_type:complete
MGLVYLVQLKPYLKVYAETEAKITGEIREMKEVVTTMTRYSMISGDVLIQMKIHELNKSIKRLENALAKTRPINNIV